MKISEIYLESNTSLLIGLCEMLNLDCTVTRTTDETINYNIVDIPGIAPKYENDLKMAYYHLIRILNRG